MSEAPNEAPEPTDDNIPDGTQIPSEDGDEEGNQDQDAGVNDTGEESWYQAGEDG
jgi:hypothetical protein